MPIDGFVGTALGGLALMVFGAVLIWISLGSPVAALSARSASDGQGGRVNSGATSARRAPRTAPSPVESPQRAARAARQRLDDALLAIALLDTVPLDSRHIDAYAPDPSPHDEYAYDPIRFDSGAADALLLRDSLDADPEEDDFYCVAAIVARCASESSPQCSPEVDRQRSATPTAQCSAPLDPLPTDGIRSTRPAGYVTAFAGSLTTHARSAA
ncbi:hypothetical protein [Actinoalloteichus hymeniacidonis]|uniref:Uncharacterized protein n=1 Tax=Actinoalloteichus hymeniacidonis TaxID=340345 RepID=A0AAC9HMP9_9PSEU|nr:hypothetical protein [Actinoalloteichus hymeniacidonis]AOS61983.1 hypothetical protein TL08_05790 [Actinoalloteichus hymeniacidonis]MBB5909995.1 hypothetical protein [Actinoalloteichus hymeniacidonis]